MEIGYKILDIILCFFFINIIKTYLDSIKVEGYKMGKEGIFVWILNIALYIWVALKNGQEPSSSFAIGIILTIWLYKAAGGLEIRSAAFKAIIYYALLLAAEGLTYYGLNYIGILDQPYGFLVSNLVSKILLFILMEYLVQRRRFWSGHGFPPKQWLALLSIPFTDICFILYILSQERSSLLGVTPLLLSIAMMIPCFIVFNVYHQLEGQAKVERENLLYVQQLNLCNQQAQEREAAYQETQRVRHDLKNYLLDIRISLSEGKIEEARRKIDKILEMNKIYKNEVSKTGNLILDSLINYRYAIACTKGISMNCRIEVPGELPFESADLSIILGNLLDNAMEAVLKLPTEERFIEITMTMLKGNLCLTIANPFLGEVKAGKDGRPATSKEDQKNHGIGLLSVCHVVNKYNGELFIQHEDNLFQVEILLYMPEIE